MAKRFAVYKGLQKPLIFRGFRGKFIYWGLGSLLAGLVLGALTMSLVNMWLGGFVLISFIFAGTPQMAVLECTIAACLFVNLIIEGVASVRLRNAMADAAGEERLSNG